jgi:molybdopterin synthase sulfur carrier subunit
MQIQILAFGQAQEITGKSSWTEANADDTDNLRIHLNQNFPELTKINFTLAVNKCIVQQNTPFSDGDVVAILPPFSGG